MKIAKKILKTFLLKSSVYYTIKFLIEIVENVKSDKLIGI